MDRKTFGPLMVIGHYRILLLWNQEVYLLGICFDIGVTISASTKLIFSVTY
jgi:hypothetical protein